jgi:3-hydroxy-3-methylglutaryl CoA synthase
LHTIFCAQNRDQAIQMTAFCWCSVNALPDTIVWILAENESYAGVASVLAFDTKEMMPARQLHHLVCYP